MFQHIVVTPQKKDKPEVKDELPEEIENLSLAPFTPNPKLEFNTTKIGAICIRKICIRNPTSSNIMLYLQKIPPHDRNVKFNWTQCMVHANTEEFFEIAWMPLCPGAWRDTIQLTDNGKVRRDIPITFKCIKPEPKRKKLGVSVKKALIKKSPQKKCVLAVQRPALTARNLLQVPVNPPSRRSTYNIPNKENHPLPIVTTKQNKPDLSSRKNALPILQPHDVPAVVVENFDDSLEMNSPSPNLPCTSQAQTNNWPDPYTPDRIAISFCCSTGRRSQGNSELIADISAETYIKGNTSGGTYIKDNYNTSGDTYVKANLSGETYVKDSSIANLADLQLSPLEEAKIPSKLPFSQSFLSPCIESPHLATFGLGRISEESSREISLSPLKKTKSPATATKSRRSPVSPTPTKRKPLTPRSNNQRTLNTPKQGKVNVTYEIKISPVKKVSPVKRLSKGYNMQPLHLKQFVKIPSPAVINRIAAEVTAPKPEFFYNNVYNPYVLAETSGADPFLALTMYYDPQWVDEQIKRFKNWLNTLLSPPKDLTCGDIKVDVAKMWQESNKEVEKAPTKEQVSSTYNTNHLLQSLRNLASKLYRSQDIIVVLSKTYGLVENNKFVIRTDKDLHQDVRLQKDILQLFFCYNPLWLRIGLEQVYGVHIHLRSNSDILGLSKFLKLNFFSNQYLLKKYKYRSSPKYAIEMKKISLKKFLSLIYFLDQAKTQKLIPYDPCLFNRNAHIKASKEILFRFSSELFHAIGDVTKPLRHCNYILQHQQSFIHEYEYGVESLGQDLKDGVRLTRVMEIILLEHNLTEMLRVPADSRLRKIHNVKITFDALKRAGYAIQSELEPKDIVEGHKEKTLSFLWQIIYKFESPRFTKAVITVQTWWRSQAIQNKLKLLREKRMIKENAAKRVQKWYRTQKLRVKLENTIPMIKFRLDKIKRSKAACKVQAQFRMFMCRKKYLRLCHGTVVIQRYFRRWYLFSHLRKKRIAAALVIQNMWRTYSQRKQFTLLRQSVAVISLYYIALKDMRDKRNEFVALRSACILIQRKYRANMLMQLQRRQYLTLKSAVSVIQIRLRATLYMKQEETRFLNLKNAAIVIQRRFRAQLVMKTVRDDYIQLRQYILKVQRQFRAQRIMKVRRYEYLNLQQATIYIQRKFRANLLCRKHLSEYTALKRAVSVIEMRYKAKQAMQQCRSDYTDIIKATIVFQTRFRAVVKARQCRKEYSQLKKTVKVCEERYAALKLMRLHRNEYQRKLRAVIFIQRKFRAQRQMHIDRNDFLKLKGAAIKLQMYYRSLILTRGLKNDFDHLRKCALVIQSRWRATLDMEINRARFRTKLRAIVKIQIWYRSVILMRSVRDNYRVLRQCVINVQRRFRANLKQRQARREFLILKENLIKIQRRFRANQLMKQKRAEFVRLRQVVINVQRRIKANWIMKQTRSNFVKQKLAVILIQQFLRGCSETQKQQLLKNQKLKAVLLLQTYGRGLLARRKFEEMNNPEIREQRRIEKLRKNAAIKIQARWRGYALRSKQPPQMVQMRKSLDAVNSNAKPEDTVYSKARQSWKVIVSEKTSIIQCMNALRVIEKVARLSENVCLLLVKKKMCLELYQLMLSSCQSRQDSEVASAAAGILINLAKCKETSKHAWSATDMPSILKMMLAYCQKEFDVFPKLATLLWVLGHNESHRGTLRQIPNFSQQMTKMLALCERQQKIVDKAYKGKNASVFASYSKMAMPRLKPDWGLDYIHAPHMFTNSVQGIRALCDLFKVNC